jgi:MFS family permease
MVRDKIKSFLSRILLPKSSLPFFSRYTYHHHYWASFIWSISGGLLGLGGYVLTKGLNATALEIALLSTAGGIPYFITPFWSQFIRRHGIRNALLVTSCMEACTLLLIAFAGVPWQFILLSTIAGTAATALLPARNFIVQQNYAVTLRGRIFGQLQTYSLFIGLGLTLLTGVFLDFKDIVFYIPWREAGKWVSHQAVVEIFRLVYPIAAVLVFMAYVQFRKIRPRGEGLDVRGSSAREESYLGNMITSFREVMKVFAGHRDFLVYEMGFMLYGTGVLMMGPVMTYFAKNDLGLGYFMFAFITSFISGVVQLVVSPIWGILMDKLKGPRTSFLIYVSLAVCALTLALGAVLKNVTIIGVGFAMHGIGMSGIGITWALGSVEFAGKGQADRYTAAHVVLVGIRSLYAPLLGVGLMYALGGAQWVFVCSAFFFVAASALMYFLRRSMQRGGRKSQAVFEA